MPKNLPELSPLASPTYPPSSSAFSSASSSISPSLSTDSLNDHHVNNLLKDIDNQIEDISKSLKNFNSNRMNVINNMSKALENYENDLKDIELSSYKSPEQVFATRAQVDHNVLKHLGINKNSTEYKEIENDLLNRPLDEEEEFNPLFVNLYTEYQTILQEKRKKVIEPVDHSPPPTFEEKVKVREQMFSFIEESTIEENRLEFKIEDTVEQGDDETADILKESLFLLRQINSDKLNNMITKYRPQPFSRVWGRDTEYLQLAQQLQELTESNLNTNNTLSISENISLDDKINNITELNNKKKKLKKKIKKIDTN